MYHWLYIRGQLTLKGVNILASSLLKWNVQLFPPYTLNSKASKAASATRNKALEGKFWKIRNVLGKEKRQQMWCPTCDVCWHEDWSPPRRCLNHWGSLYPQGSVGEACVGGLWSPRKQWLWPFLCGQWHLGSDGEDRTSRWMANAVCTHMNMAFQQLGLVIFQKVLLHGDIISYTQKRRKGCQMYKPKFCNRHQMWPEEVHQLMQFRWTANLNVW